MTLETLDDLRNLTTSDWKNVRKQQIIDLIVNSPVESGNVGDLHVAVVNLTKTVTDLRKDLSDYHDEQVKISTTIVSLTSQNRLLEDKVKNLEYKVAEFEQRSRIKNVEIIGLTGTSDEENETQALELFASMGVPMDAMDIEACHVVPTRRRDKRAPVIVAFANRKWKDRVLAKKRELFKKNKDTQAADRVYVNEHLSPRNKRIYQSCMSVKTKVGCDEPQRVYKYVWTKQGTTFLRKDVEGAKAIRVESIEKAIELGINIIDY